MELATDGGPQFASHTTQQFLRTWGVKWRVSSAYNPQSNGRAELAVKTANASYERTSPRVLTSTQILLHVHYSSIAIHLFRISEYHLLSCCMVDNSVTTYLLLLMLSKSDKNGSNWLKTESAHLHIDTYALWRHTTSTPDHFRILKSATMSWYKNQTGNQPTRWDKNWASHRSSPP